MKALFVVPCAVAGLLITAGAANGQSAGLGVQPVGRATLEQNADESVQDITDMSYKEVTQPANAQARSITNLSYGGTPDIKGEAGVPRAQPCVAGPQCNIFRGR